ncbi:MAG: hypothetical protein AB1689_28625 [Thermodesulfobacteriota bacterium]
MGEPFRSPWLDWAPPAEKKSAETPTQRTDTTDRFESVSSVGSLPRGAGALFSLRVVVDAIEPRPGPIRLNAWTVILHPARSIAADLASLERVAAGLAEARRAGDRHAVERFEDERDDLLARLTACGARVRVVPVS